MLLEWLVISLPNAFAFSTWSNFVLVTCFQLKSDKMSPCQVYHELISSAHIFRKMSLKQWLEALTKTRRYKLLEEFTGESLLNNCLCRIASCQPQDNWLPLWFKISGDRDTIFRKHIQQKINSTQAFTSVSLISLGNAHKTIQCLLWTVWDSVWLWI